MRSDTLLRHRGVCIKCEIDGPRLTYTYSDEPKYHKVATLRFPYSYDELKKEVREIYNSYNDKDEGFAAVSDFLQTVDCHCKYFEEGSYYGYFDLRSRDEIDDYLKEAQDKVWLMRSCFIDQRKPVHEVGRTAMNRIFDSYDDIPKGGYDDWECGYWNGIMGALRWVLGEEKDFLDT